MILHVQIVYTCMTTQTSHLCLRQLLSGEALILHLFAIYTSSRLLLLCLLLPFVPNSDSDRSPCEVARCPRVWCDSSLQYTPVGDCCPTCPPLPSITVPTISSNGCTEDDGVHYSEGETWKRDSCVTCTCEAGLPLCSSVSCVLPDCENPVHLPGECCPSCPSLSIDPIAVFIPAKTECEENGELHENGASWKRDSCTTCFCEEGEVLCASRSCWVDCENPIHLPDVCCPICPGKNTQPCCTSETNCFCIYVLLHTYFVQAEIYIFFFRAEDGPHDDATAEPSVPAPTSLPVPSPIEPVVVFYPATVHCEHRGQIYEDGATWNPNGDMCTSCICEQGLNLCIAKSCWVDCENPVFLPDVCCPVCPGTAVTYGSCTIYPLAIFRNTNLIFKVFYKSFFCPDR